MGNTTTLNMTTLDGGNVIIKRGTAPTPPSGGESGGNWKYYRCTSPSVYSTYFIGVYNIVRVENAQLPNAVFLDSGMLMYMSKNDTPLFESCVALAINMNEKITNMQTLEIMTKGDVSRDNINVAVSSGVLTEITKEEFYKLD